MRKIRIVIEISEPEVVDRLDGMSEEELIESLDNGCLAVDLCNECSCRVEFEEGNKKPLISDRKVRPIGRD